MNGVLCESTCQATSNYYYAASGDERHTLEVNGAYVEWTKPDGTIARFAGGTHAANIGLLSQVIYPNGFTITIATGQGIYTNTGFQLKYLYEADNRPFDKVDNPNLINVPPASTSAASGWSGINPKYIDAINNAFDYCAPGATSCSYSRTWPRTTFNWPAGMPRTMFIGSSAAEVVDPLGRKTIYSFLARDLAYAEDGTTVVPPYIPNREFSPRVSGIKTGGSNTQDITYQFKNLFTSDGSEFGMYDIRLQTAGATKAAPANIATFASYEAQHRFSGVTDNVGTGYSNVPRVGTNPNINGNPSALEFVDTLDGRLTYEPYAIRNFPTRWAPYTGPTQDYQYTRSNLTRIDYRLGQSDQTYVEAVYPASCTPSTRKTCNQATSIRDARGNWTDYTYHAASGQVETVTSPANSVISSRGVFESVRAQTRYTYQQLTASYYQGGGSKVAGAPIWMKTAEKYCINSNYVGGACEGGDEVTTAFEYSSDNLLLTGTIVTAQGTAGSLRSCFQYDVYGNQIGKIEPNANLSSCTASPSTSAQAEAGYLHADRYNIAGQVTGTIAPDPDGAGALRLKATRNTFGAIGDNRGLLIKSESGELASFPNESVDPAAWSGYGFTVFSTQDFTYDSYGRKVTESLKGSDGISESLVQYSYDAQSRIDCKAVRMNKSAFVSLPASACALGTEGSFGPDRITKYTYDGLDQVLTEKRALGVTNLEQTYVTNTYTHRQLTSQKDANGNLTTLEYDTYSRLKKRIYPSQTTPGFSNANDYNQYGYDANGNLVYERKRDGTTWIDTTFDGNNRPTFKNLSNNTYSGDVCTSFDLRGLVTSSRFASCPTSLQSPLGLGITNVFDGFGRQTSTTNDMGNFTRTLTFDSDKNGNRIRVQHPSGGPFFQYHFDGLNRVADVKENDLSTLVGVTYRPNGQRLSLTRGNGVTTTFTPDAANRLGSFFQDFPAASNDLTNQFSYNSANQITQLIQSNNTYAYSENFQRTGSYAPNGLNQYVTAGGYSAQYDTNANLTSYAGQTFTYDMENRLVATTGPNASLKYDPLGRLFEYSPPVPGLTTQFLYAGDALVAEYTISGGVSTQTRRYVHGDQVDEPWVQYNVSGGNARRYLHPDHQGSIIAHSDDTAAVTNKLTYDAYGIPATSNVDRFAYTGQTWFKELGLFHYKARVYNPKLGRFLQMDPIFYKDDLNLYAYVGQDPMNRSDPTGMKGCAGGYSSVDKSGKGEGCTSDGATNDYDTSASSSVPSQSGGEGINLLEAVDSTVKVVQASSAGVAGFGSPKATVPALATSKLAEQVGGKLVAPAQNVVAGVQFSSQVSNGQYKEAANTALSTGERLAGGAVGLQLGTAVGGPFAEVTGPLGLLVGGLAPDAMQGLNRTLIDGVANLPKNTGDYIGQIQKDLNNLRCADPSCLQR